jgi:hypothetical protein
MMNDVMCIGSRALALQLLRLRSVTAYPFEVSRFKFFEKKNLNLEGFWI